MAPYDNPTVLVTRPKAGAAAFVAALRRQTHGFRPVFAPAFGFESIAHQIPPFDHAIFTSQAGVAFAPQGAGRVAWCVGDVTARAAGLRGYEARSAHGDANDLTEMILKDKPASRLVHIRGETSRGNVTQRLVAAGLRCADVMTYRKAKLDPPRDLVGQLNGDRMALIPVFSAETVSIIAKWSVQFPPCHVVAISADVAQASDALTPQDITLTQRPDMASMTQAIAALIA